MAVKNIILMFGNSQTEGGASLAAVSDQVFTRWTGETYPDPVVFPVDITAPGIYFWTPKLPYATYTEYTIDGSGATSVSATVATTATVDQWIYVNQATTGQGQTARVTVVGGGGADLTVPAWTAPSTTNSTFQLITQSHTLSGAQTSTVLTKSANTVDFSSATGKWAIVISGSAIGQASRVASGTTTALTLEDALTIVPSAGDGIVLLDGTGSVDAVSSYTTGNCSWQQMRYYYDASFTFRTGIDYPNFKSYPKRSPATFTFGEPVINYSQELTWQLKAHHKEDLYCVHMGINSAYMSPQLANQGNTAFSWFDPDLHNDFHPSSSTNLYSVMVGKALTLGCAQIVAAGDTPNIIGVFCTPGELESIESYRANKFSKTMRLIRDSIREASDNNGWSTMRGSSIPFVMTTIPTSNWTYQTTVNDAMVQMAKDDAATGVVDTTSGYDTTDGIHYDTDAYIALGVAMFEKWKELTTRQFDAAQQVDTLLSLSSLRTAVRRRYERNGSGNDDSNTQIDQFVNDSLREIYNTMGTNAWFLRRVEQLTMETAYPGTLTLPYPVRQLLRIENVNYPGRPVEHKGISYTDSGRIQITLHDYTGGPYYVHFMTMPQDLVNDADRALIPPHHVELVVMLACKRLAEAAGNISVATYFASESARLWSILKKEALRMDRFRNESMTTIPAYDSWRNGAAGSTMGYL